MNKILMLVTMLALMSLIAFPVAAAPDSYQIEIDVDTLFEGNVTYPSPFVASGSAVDAGIICETGMVYDIQGTVAGPPDASRINFHLVKQFVCDDGSGSFYVNLMARVIFDPYSDTGVWNTLDGSGAYTDLHGRGTLEGTPTATGVFDVYRGWVTVK